MKKTTKFQVAMVAIAVISIGGYVFANFNNANKADARLQEVKIMQAAVEMIEDSADVQETVAMVDSTVEASYEATTNNCVSNVYGEGDVFGTINYNGTESAVVVGTVQENLEHQAMLHSASTSDHIVVLGHSYADGSVFGCLTINHKVGTQVELSDMRGTSIKYSVVSAEWVDEDSYNTSEYVSSIFEDDSDLVLITCQKKDGSRGRLIVKCEQNA